MFLSSTSLDDAKRAALQTLHRLSPSLDAPQRARLAREHGALVRARKVPDADTLLHLLLFYTHACRSLRWGPFKKARAGGVEIVRRSCDLRSVLG